MSISGIAGRVTDGALAGILMQPAVDRNADSTHLPGQSDTLSERSQDSVTLSAEARKLGTSSDAPGFKDFNGLTEEQRKEVEKLKETDQKVRAHEQAHLAAAGGLAKGSPHFDYAIGPDGRQYAVGGEASIDTSAVPGDPEATLQKARQIERAADAPGDPSPQDEQVAAAAAAMAQEAEAELSSRRSAATGGLISVFA